MSQDVAAFLTWTAEPKLENRRRAGLATIFFLLIATSLAYMAYQNIWADKKKARSEEHTSELQSLMRISYAVFCFLKKIITNLSVTYQYHIYCNLHLI